MGSGNKPETAVSIESLKNPRKVWGTFESEFKEVEQINLSAWWNYQRNFRKIKQTNKVASIKGIRTSAHEATFPKIKQLWRCAFTLVMWNRNPPHYAKGTIEMNG
jgi:hypothetical protein